MEIIAKLKDQGWYLADDGIKKLPEDVDKSDTRKIIKAAMDMDFREIAGGALPTDLSRKDEAIPGRIVLQISKIRNIAAPKANEENQYAPRFFQLELTDGINQIQALEIENISALNFNTPPGTKIYLKCEKIPLMLGMLLLKSKDIDVLGGKVLNLIEKWEMSRTLLKYAKGGRVMNGGSSGPPPWTPFGQRIQQQNINVGNDKNFKSLANANEKEGKENNEFDTMRNEAIAEAAKAGSKKVFGGGNQQIVDHNVKKILEKGYTEEEAKNALRATRNNLEKALFNLKRRDEYRNKDDSKSSYDKSRSNLTPNDRNSLINTKRGLNNTRESFSNKKSGKEDSVPTKPAGNVSLFDFLTDKLPSNSNETEKSASSSSQNQQQYGASSSSNHQQSHQSSRYESRNERSSRPTDSYSTSNSKSSYYSNNNNNSHTQQQQSSSYSDGRNQNHQQNPHHIPNSQSNRGSMSQKFENNLSSSFQANRNYSQDNERPRNRNNRESTERSGSSNTASNRNYQNSYQGRSGGGGSGNDRQYDEQNSDRYYNSRDQRNTNYNQRTPKSQQVNERDGGSRSGGNERSNYQGSNPSHFQYHQHQNNNGNNYDNNRNSRNDNQSYRNGYDNSRSGGNSNSYQNNKGNHSQMSTSRYSQKDNSTNSYQQNQSSNNSRGYSDNRQQQSYHQQQQSNRIENSDAKINKIIEDTSKLKIDQQSQQQSQQHQQLQHQQHSQKSRHNQTTSSHRNQNYQQQQQQQEHQQPHLTSQHQTQIMTVVSHQGPPSNQPQIQQHSVQTNQPPHTHFQPPPQVHSAQHSLQTSAFTQLPNGFAYDPNKIMGFQNKETNEFAMTLLKSQGIPTALTPTTALAPPQPQHPHPSVTPTAAPQSTTPHPGAAAYPTMQIGHPPPPTMSQHSFATAGPAFVMQPTSIAPPPQLATIGPQVAHTHTPVAAGLPGSLQGPPQQNPGAAFSMNPGDSWNWKIGDRCIAKYWDDGRYYQAEITGISDKTCVVFYLGYGNHEEVLKADCLPITDAQNRAINFGGTQTATVVAIQQQPPPHTAVQLSGASRGALPNRYRGDRQMYVPPPKRDG